MTLIAIQRELTKRIQRTKRVQLKLHEPHSAYQSLTRPLGFQC